MKAYTTKSNARRAAKSAGLEQFEIIEVEGGFSFQAVAQEENAPAIETPAEMDQTTFEEVQESGDLEERLDAALAVADQEEKKAPTRKIEVTNESTAESLIGPSRLVLPAKRPCKLVWHIADEMKASNPEVKRKEVLAECVKRGVAFYTARTQYQLWLGVQKEMAARVASQAAE